MTSFENFTVKYSLAVELDFKFRPLHLGKVNAYPVKFGLVLKERNKIGQNAYPVFRAKIRLFKIDLARIMNALKIYTNACNRCGDGRKRGFKVAPIIAALGNIDHRR